MIKAILFDIDGTLVNSLDTYLHAYGEVLKHYGFVFKDSQVVEKCFGRTEESICKDLGIPKKAEEFRNLYYREVDKAIGNLQLFQEAIDTLENLKASKIKIGLITMAHRWYLEKITKKFSLDKYAKVFVSFNDVEKSKPAPDAVIKACKILKINPAEALIVGDSRGDIFMGKNAGSKTALYAPSENSEFYDFKQMIKDINPDYVLTSLKKIRNLT